MGPVMPPSKKPEGSGISVSSGLSQCYRDSDLSKTLHDDEDLDFSLPALRLEKGPMEDEELTNLNWLHESKNLLKSFGDSVLRSVSPVQDVDDDTPPSPAHADMPYDAKQNPNCKPPYSFSCLIFMAIEDSPTKRLPVKDIYNWILEHFPYFANAPTGWKNSVRHNLSLNKCFKKVDKDRSQSIGKGSLWCIDPEYRQNLIQALKKTPYHPYSHVFSTPPASPQAYQSTSGPPIWPGSTFFKRNGALLQDSEYAAGQEEEALDTLENSVSEEAAHEEDTEQDGSSSQPQADALEDSSPTRLTPRSRLRQLQGRNKRSRRGETIAVAFMQQQSEECRSFLSLERSFKNSSVEQQRESNDIMRNIAKTLKEESLVGEIRATRQILERMVNIMEREESSRSHTGSETSASTHCQIPTRSGISNTVEESSSGDELALPDPKRMSIDPSLLFNDIISESGDSLIGSQSNENLMGNVAPRSKRVPRKKLPFSP